MDQSQYIHTGVSYSDAGTTSEDFAYQLGEGVFFGRKSQGDGEKYFLYGYNTPEDYLMWSAGSATEMIFDLPENPWSDLLLEINYEAMPGQRINVYVNGHLLTQEFPLDAGASFCSIKIPLKMLQNNMQLFIQFEFPNAISSYKLGINEDIRVLAMGLKSLKMNSAGASSGTP